MSSNAENVSIWWRHHAWDVAVTLKPKNRYDDNFVVTGGIGLSPNDNHWCHLLSQIGFVITLGFNEWFTIWSRCREVDTYVQHGDKTFTIFCCALSCCGYITHYSDLIMSAMASQIFSVSRVCSTVCSGVDQRKYQSSASLAFVRGIHRWPADSPLKAKGQYRGKCFHLMTSSWHPTELCVLFTYILQDCFIVTRTLPDILHWALWNKCQWNLNQNTVILVEKVNLKLSSAKCRPLCSYLYELLSPPHEKQSRCA